MPKFEVFQRGRRAAVGAYVSIQTKGAMAISFAAWESIGRPEAVRLLWSGEDGGIVGLQPCGLDEDNAYRVRMEGKNPEGPRALAARDFTKHYDIDTSGARRFPVQVENGVLLFKLNTGTATSRQRSTPPARPVSADAARNRRIREWGVTNGLLSRMAPGRIPQTVVDAYDAAHRRDTA